MKACLDDGSLSGPAPRPWEEPPATQHVSAAAQPLCEMSGTLLDEVGHMALSSGTQGHHTAGSGSPWSSLGRLTVSAARSATVPAACPWLPSILDVRQEPPPATCACCDGALSMPTHSFPSQMPFDAPLDACVESQTTDVSGLTAATASSHVGFASRDWGTWGGHALAGPPAAASSTVHTSGGSRSDALWSGYGHRPHLANIHRAGTEEMSW